MAKEEVKNTTVAEDEISLLEIFSFMWSKKIFVLKVTAIFIVLGVLHTLISPDEYTADVVLLPESGSSSGVTNALGALSGLGGIFGNLPAGSGGGGIGPGLYPEVIKSTPFMLPLMSETFYFETIGQELTMQEYFSNYVKKGFSPVSWLRKIPQIPYIIIGWFRSSESPPAAISLTENGERDQIMKLTGEQVSVSTDLASRIAISSKGSVITISVKMQDPVVAAQLAEYTQESLTEYVTNYRISKEKRNLEFIEESCNEAEQNFIRAQERLAIFRDRNQNVATAIARSEEERLQSEYNLRFNLYNNLAQQLEKAKIAVQEVTPIFEVLEPVKIPLSKSEPNGERNFMISVVLGIFFGFMIVFAKKFYQDFIKGRVTSGNS